MPKNSVLIHEGYEDYRMFSKLLAKADAEGRIDGKHRCPMCGMRYNSDAESTNCCPRLMSTSPGGQRHNKEKPTKKLPKFQPMNWKRRRGAQ